MSSAKITLLGMENWLNAENDSLFNSLILPSDINKNDFINNIMLEGGEFEVIFSDPYLLKDMISLWGRKWNQAFTKWSAALNKNYEPLENYDREEIGFDVHTGTVQDAGTDTHTGTVTLDDDKTQSGTVQDSGTNTGTVTDSGTNTGTVQNSGSNEHEVSGFNSSSYSPDNQDTNGNTRTDNLANSNTRTDNLANSNTRTDNLAFTDDGTTTYNESFGKSNTRTNNLRDDHSLRIHGNIGVTTSQQMLQSELDLRYWNLLNRVTSLFLAEFVIPIY